MGGEHPLKSHYEPPTYRDRPARSTALPVDATNIKPCWSLYTTGSCTNFPPCPLEHDITAIETYIDATKISAFTTVPDDPPPEKLSQVHWADILTAVDESSATDTYIETSDVFSTLAELKAKYIRDFHRQCTLSFNDTSVLNINIVFDTGAEFTNYIKAAFLTTNFPDIVTHPVTLGNVGGSLGGTQCRDTAVHLTVATLDHTGTEHSWSLEFVILTDLPYDAFIGSTAIKGPLRDFFFTADNWTSGDIYVTHDFPDSDDAPEDSEPMPGLFPAEYFSVMTTEDLRTSLSSRISPEYHAHSPTILNELLTYRSTWINNYQGLTNIPILKIQWLEDTPVTLRV